MKTLTLRRATAVWIVLICAFLATSAAVEAQLTGYPGKVVCGFEQGNVPLLNDPTPLTPPRPYENFKPGNYATVFNVLNLNPTQQMVTFVLTLQNFQPVTIFILPVNAFSSIEIGCEEIFNPFIPPLVGQRFEGMLIPVTNNSSFVVDAVYTFESQNAFERHVVYEDGIATWSFGRSLDDILRDFNPPTGFFIEAASGAGGLGLGASIDVVRIDPVALLASILDATTDVFPVDDLAGTGDADATQEPAGGAE